MYGTQRKKGMRHHPLPAIGRRTRLPVDSPPARRGIQFGAAKTHAARSIAMSVQAISALCLGVLLIAGSGGAVPAEPAGRITGVGGVFFKAKDPKTLAAWYC